MILALTLVYFCINVYFDKSRIILWPISHTWHEVEYSNIFSMFSWHYHNHILEHFKISLIYVTHHFTLEIITNDEIITIKITPSGLF